MLLRYLVPAIVLLLALTRPGGAQGPNPDGDGDRLQEPIVVRVEAVNLLVTVTDRRTGRFVPDLNLEDFRIYEDGERQEITHFARQTDLPLTIALCMDTSASVRLKLGFQKEAASEFLYSVMRPADRALLLEFDTGVTLLHDFTSNPNDLVREIRNLRAGGGTALYDAIYLVGEQKMLEETGRKTVVLLTDGADLTSRHSFEDAIRMSQRAEMTIYGIGTTRFGANIDYEGENILKQLTESTGGRAFFPYSTKQLEEAFRAIDEELRNQYSLTYGPSRLEADGSFRNLKVEVNRRGLQVRHREGYYAGLN